MSEQPTKAEVLASIVPKSDQLNADDLLTGPITVKITKVRKGDKEQPIIVDIEGHRPYRPCKSMRRILISVFSDAPDKWIGEKLTLYCDPDVMWAGVRVGGIRISHMTGLATPTTFSVTKTRGKKEVVTIQPIIETISENDRQSIDNILEEIETCTTLETLKAIGFVIKQKPSSVQEAVREQYKVKQKQLKESEGS